MICTHSYITLRCEWCGALFGDEYQYGATDRERDRIRMDALAHGWQLKRSLFAPDIADKCADCSTPKEPV